VTTTVQRFIHFRQFVVCTLTGCADIYSVPFVCHPVLLHVSNASYPNASIYDVPSLALFYCQLSYKVYKYLP